MTDNYESASSNRVLRGGNWNNHTANLRVAARLSGPGDGHGPDGFRCVSGSNFTSGSSAGEDFTSDEEASAGEKVLLPLAGKEMLNLADTSVTKVQVSVNPNKVSASVNTTAEVTVALYNPEKNLVKGDTVNLSVG